MINLKTDKEIKIMHEGGKILTEVFSQVLAIIKPGVSELELEKLAEKIIIKKGGYPAFKRVSGYKYATCISTNDTIVHGIPTGYVLKEGDIIGVDCGVYYKGLNTDAAWTLRVKSQNSNLKSQKYDDIDMFLETGKKALEEAIKQAKPGNRVGHISKTIQEIVEGSGYSIVKNLVGHGVGRQLHEYPEIPGFLDDLNISQTPVLKEGMTVAIEVIYNMGSFETRYDKDGWTIKTKDGSLSGLFERTVAITKKGPKILTRQALQL